jgi:hypothetical protein
MERNLLSVIGYESLICVTVYEFIKTYFYDFKYNNQSYIIELDIENLVSEFEEASVYFAKLLMHYESFYKYG